jgi:CelD/BcsL family acetyltransferase involved in cellulose biosynthesis
LRGLTALHQVEQLWRSLLSDSATETLFLQPDWVLPWLETYQRPSRGLLTFQGGQPQALALFTEQRLAGFSIIRPPGLGVSDYLDLLLPRKRPEAEAALRALLDWLMRAGGWDLLDLPNLPCEGPTAELLAAEARRRRLPLYLVSTHRRPYLSLDGSWERFLASRPQKLRYNLRARRRHLAQQGDLRVHHSMTPQDIARRLPDAVALHARRWAGQRTSTTFSSSATAQRFYARALGTLSALGQVDLAALELDGRLLAFALCFVRGEKLYYYLPGFDPDFARFAPSSLLLADLINWAFARGLRELDFMLGDEPYKAQWASGIRGTQRLLLAAPCPRGSLALTAFRAYLAARERARQSERLQRLRRYGLKGLRA